MSQMLDLSLGSMIYDVTAWEQNEDSFWAHKFLEL